MNLRVIAAYTCMTLLLFTGIARAQESTTTEGPTAPAAFGRHGAGTLFTLSGF
jgi:hypothetical protein